VIERLGDPAELERREPWEGGGHSSRLPRSPE
jgi:hypothetical protein